MKPFVQQVDPMRKSYIYIKPILSLYDDVRYLQYDVKYGKKKYMIVRIFVAYTNNRCNKLLYAWPSSVKYILALEI